MPHVHTVDGDPTVAYALAYPGTVVAMATYLERSGGEFVAGVAVAADTLVAGTEPLRFTLSFLRRASFAGAYVVYGLKDR